MAFKMKVEVLRASDAALDFLVAKALGLNPTARSGMYGSAEPSVWVANGRVDAGVVRWQPTVNPADWAPLLERLRPSIVINEESSYVKVWNEEGQSASCRDAKLSVALCRAIALLEFGLVTDVPLTPFAHDKGKARYERQ